MENFVYTPYSPYAIISNENMPSEVKEQMLQVSKMLEAKGYTARIGSDDSLDQSIEACISKHELFLPWKKFNGKEGPNCKFPIQKFGSTEPTEGENITKQFIPVWDNFKPAVKKIIARNAYVVFGEDLKNPIKFMVCWTPDGCENAQSKNAKTGRIGTAISIASSIKVPVFNLKNGDAMSRLTQFIER